MRDGVRSSALLCVFALVFGAGVVFGRAVQPSPKAALRRTVQDTRAEIDAILRHNPLRGGHHA